MYNLSQLTAFNQALVYAFEPEASMARLQGSESFKDTIYPEAGQHLDVFDAYLYAQDVILPQIKAIGIDNITEQMLLSWILEIHKRIAKHLLSEYGLKPGEYTAMEPERWQQGMNVVFSVYDLINNNVSFDKHAQKFVKSYASEHKLDIKTCELFVAIIKSAREEVKREYKKPINPLVRDPAFVTNVIEKIKTLRRKNKLSEIEQNALDEIVIFCMPADEVPAAMQDFAKATLERWKQCANSHPHKIAELIAETFYQLTSIHPFPNGNGRVATCVVNIILKSLGFADILVRIPGDRNNATSSYSKAMACIAKTRSLFVEHIHHCIEIAKHKPYQNSKLARATELRINFYLKCLDLEKYPGFNIEVFKEKIYIILNKIARASNLVDDEILQLEASVELSIAEEKELKLKTKAPVMLFSPANPLSLYNQAIKVYKEDKNYAKAMEDLEKAIVGFKEKKGEFSEEIARCYSALASVHRDKASDTNKEYASATEICAQALICLEEIKSKDMSPVIVKYKQCLSLHNQQPLTIYDLAISAFKNKHYQVALCQLQYCIDKWQGSPEHNIKLAKCYSTIASCQRELGLIDEALVACDLALSHSNNDASMQRTISAKREAIETLNSNKRVANTI